MTKRGWASGEGCRCLVSRGRGRTLRRPKRSALRLRLNCSLRRWRLPSAGIMRVARHARAQRIVLDGLAERANAYLQIVDDLMVAGAATALAKENAALTAQQVRGEAAQARGREEMANAAVIRWTGQPPAMTESPCAPPDSGPNKAVNAHPDMQRARAAAAVAKAEAFAVQREQ